MNAPTYIPVFRLRQQEKKVLTSFDFGNDMYPYVEIFKHFEQQPRIPKPGSKTRPKPAKRFNEIYLPTLRQIKSDKVFVDLPVHLKVSNKMKKEVIEFLRGVVGKRDIRTAHLMSLNSISEKMIPVISTYSQRTGEPNSIKLQEADLRPAFQILAFRTSALTFSNDMIQISAVAQAHDFLFIDLEERCLANDDDMDAIQFMIDHSKTFDACHVVLMNSPIDHMLTNTGLDHGEMIARVDNSLMDKFESFGANSFADQAGVKRDVVESGGGISPGFIYYDAVENSFYGYKGLKRVEPELDDFRSIIIRDVLTSAPTERMRRSRLSYLCRENIGWRMIEDMWAETEPWKSQAKFKRIAMEHYLHCMKAKILNGYFVL
jgi:hypothetical protein